MRRVASPFGSIVCVFFSWFPFVFHSSFGVHFGTFRFRGVLGALLASCSTAVHSFPIRSRQQNVMHKKRRILRDWMDWTGWNQAATMTAQGKHWSNKTDTKPAITRQTTLNTSRQRVLWKRCLMRRSISTLISVGVVSVLLPLYLRLFCRSVVNLYPFKHRWMHRIGNHKRNARSKQWKSGRKSACKWRGETNDIYDITL